MLLPFVTFLLDRFLSFPAEYRLPFREFGMAIGLHAVERIEGLMGEKPNVFSKNHPVCSQIKYLRRFLILKTGGLKSGPSIRISTA